MSLSPASNLYLDQYFPQAEAINVEASPLDNYESFDQSAFLLGEEIQPIDESANSEELGALGEESFEEELVEPSAKQKSTMEWLEEHGQDLEENFLAAQEKLADLQGGVEDLDPEKRRLQLEEVESTLSQIERELSKYADKEESLRDSELPEELWEFDSNVDAENMEEELESIRKDLGKEIENAKTEENEAAEAEAKAEQKEKDGRALKDQLSDALGYLNGGKDKLYFTAKVWGDKHIKDYHEDVTQYALAILSQMADAASSGEWESVTTLVQGLDSGAADNTLGLVGLILSKYAPQTLDKLPSNLLEAMSDAILRGNGPGDSNIYYINQDGKYDGPKDDRRRKDMGHESFSYQDAAEIFQAKAESNRVREEVEAEENQDSSDEEEWEPSED